MNRTIFSLFAMSLLSMPTMAQQLDFNIASRKASEVTALNFTPIGMPQSSSHELAAGNGITILVEAPLKGQVIKSTWFKQGIQQGEMLTSDGIAVYQQSPSKDKKGKPTIELTSPTKTPCAIRLTIKGLKAGLHSILAYHNIVDGLTAAVPPVQVSMNGATLCTSPQTIRAMKAMEAGQSYIEFEAEEGKPVVITYQTLTDKKATYATTSLTLNGIVLDKPNPKMTALNPSPADDDLHVDFPHGVGHLSWQAGEGAKLHHIYIGSSPKKLQKVATLATTHYSLQGLGSDQTYYWRIDEETADGKVSKGEVWTFRPRRVAFPGAEGYGQFATGGRGGIVYHVTSLADDSQNPQPGTLRYGITRIHQPRTIVFDISGTIDLKDRLVCSDPFVTVAGQTAPGKGILLREHPFGFGPEGIFRFLRLRLGKYLDKDGKTITLDGMGAAGCDNTIIDHCSVGWTIDEAFSSRNGRNISFQHNLISEALNQAGHQNYANAKHGYAATIGGNIGSFHHNLLAHNEGRNWSMGGGLDGAGYYAGRLDLFNNVVYNWGNRACDGGAHEVNFVGNYYKMGPATSMKFILNAQLEGTGKGSQAYYIHDNIRQNYIGDMKQNAGPVAGKHGELVSDREGETYQYTTKNHQVVDWQVFNTTKPFFPSLAKVESARAAFKNVLSDVGANQPQQDEHDKRMIEETLKGSYKYIGSKTGKKGLIDDNKDANDDAWKEFETTEARPANWDTDQDGMPDWWEKLTGSNPQVADNNVLTHGEYTQLERYLNWLAEPHFMAQPGQRISIDMKQYFAGYDHNPSFHLIGNTPNGVSLKWKKNGILEMGIGKKTQPCLIDFTIEASDQDNVATLQRVFHIAVTAVDNSTN